MYIRDFLSVTDLCSMVLESRNTETHILRQKVIRNFGSLIHKNVPLSNNCSKNEQFNVARKHHNMYLV
jgi:hypothetical protein